MRIKTLLVASSIFLASLTINSPVLSQNITGKFDFYVLSLSWSPDYCAKNGSRDPQQCKIGKKLGFVLHGLWPQNEKGYPANCTTQKLPSAVKQKFPGLFPSDKLYNHQWNKHGTCSGKTPEEYLSFSKKLKDSVAIPSAYHLPKQPFRTTIKDLKTAFISANSELSPNSIAPYCSDSGRFLKEVFFCFSKDGKAGICSQEIIKRSQKSCGQANFLVRGW
ncbi:ribonuclease [Anabaena sp. FACHB-1237]|nr:ribonuclease [Anabaena sp. FACHB-1237]